MATEKLKGLHRFLESLNMVDENHLDSWAEHARCTPLAQPVGDGYIVTEFDYQAVFVIEGFRLSADQLMAQLSIWISTNDEGRQDKGLPPPDIQIDIMDDQSAEVEIKIQFVESIGIVAADDGPIDYLGKKWKSGMPEVSMADEGSVADRLGQVPDAQYAFKG